MDDIRLFIAEQGAKNSPATALVRFKSSQQFFRHCIEEEELDQSPTTGMRAPNFEREPPPIIDDGVPTRLLKSRSRNSLGDRRDTAILRTFIDTGCRLSEVTNLRVRDVDLGRQVIAVRGKGNRVRTVTFGAKTHKAIDRYLRQIEREQPVLGGGCDIEGSTGSGRRFGRMRSMSLLGLVTDFSPELGRHRVDGLRPEQG